MSRTHGTGSRVIDDERAAVQDGQHAVETLLDRLADVATPAGPTPRDLIRGRLIALLPMYDPPKESPQNPSK